MELVGKDLIDFELPYMSESGLSFLKLSDVAKEKKIILAFFPAAWTSVCTKELCTFRDSMAEFNNLNAEVLGISIDTPFALNAFKKEQKLNFTLLSDANRSVINKYDVVWPNLSNAVNNVANRAVFVIKNGKIAYQWIGEHPGKMPDFDEIKKQL